MNINKLNSQKIEMWQKKLPGLEKSLLETMQRRGLAAQEGDLRENAAFQQADEEAVVLRVRIEEVKKLIKSLGGSI